MDATEDADWQRLRFGSTREPLGDLAREVVREAHERSLEAHIAGGLKTKKTYGVTMTDAVRELWTAGAVGIAGVTVRRPAGVRAGSDVVVIDETATVIYPWRYGRDAVTPRDEARMAAASKLQSTLFQADPDVAGSQLTLEQGQLSVEEIERLYADEADLQAQLRDLHRVVVLGYASHPGGLRELGWGEIELVDRIGGHVRWLHWEALDEASIDTAPAGELRGVSDDSPVVATVDAAPPVPGFDLVARQPSLDPVADEPTKPADSTGREAGGPAR